jgi:hypothetical protein
MQRVRRYAFFLPRRAVPALLGAVVKSGALKRKLIIDSSTVEGLFIH